MKILKTCILFFLITQIWAFNAIAQTAPYPDFTQCIEEPTKIIYSNGVLGIREDAEETAIIILDSVTKQMKEDLIVTIANNATNFGWGYCHDFHQDIQWNPSEGALLDLYEAWIQLRGDDPSGFIKGLLRIISWPASFISTVIDRASKTPPPPTRADLFNFANDYASAKHPVGPREQLYPWRYVIVAHSQGNFFSNDVYTKYLRGHGNLSEIRLIGVATPDNEIADGGPYVTLNEDQVIKNVRAFVTGYNALFDPDLPLPMPSTTTNSRDNGINHNFLNSYFFEGSHTEGVLIQHIIDRIDKVPFTRKDPDDPTIDIPLEPAGINPTTGEQEPCPRSNSIFVPTGYECTGGILNAYCQFVGPSCTAN